MASTQSTAEANFQIASQGGFGHNMISTGTSSVAGRIYFAVEAQGECTISYNKYDLPFNTDGDASVAGLVIKDGASMVLGAVTDIAVTGGTLKANLVKFY